MIDFWLWLRLLFESPRFILLMRFSLQRVTSALQVRQKALNSNWNFKVWCAGRPTPSRSIPRFEGVFRNTPVPVKVLMSFQSAHKDEAAYHVRMCVVFSDGLRRSHFFDGCHSLTAI